MLPLLLQTASLRKTRNPASPNPRASAARSVAGRPERTTNGFAPAGTSGTRSTLEAFAQPACTSGLKPNASRAVDGRRTRCGMQGKKSALSRVAIGGFLEHHRDQSAHRRTIQ
jgi:hypothetical protein